ncbi:MAG: DUF2188 domain-containing protein [Candidatus Methanomethylophilus sp.]|nr:DUF2188 domain-containing protein [Methanomethylophilus sp.]
MSFFSKAKGKKTEKDRKIEKKKASPEDEATMTKPRAEPKKTAPAEKKTVTDESDKPKIWHITKRAEDGKWQIKAEGALRATKLFNTKTEAEEYVKTLKANNEGSRIVSHKKDGKYQKK